jgi:glycosyltransferase involved in cell wall biosynthesis
MIQVLLSTYNGEKYLEILIDSILAQDYPDFELLIRDDGSTDQTVNILKKYQDNKKIRLVLGQNIGVAKSFFDLIGNSAPVEFFAFCDQDDLWAPHKLKRAMEMLDEYSTCIPLLYCSKTELVDENLDHLGYSKIPYRELTLSNALVENIATGCTVVFNKKARDLIRTKLPSAAVIHDWWLYLAVSAFGKVIFDRETFIKHRQHDRNLTSEQLNLFIFWAQRLRRFSDARYLRPRIQAQEFFNIFGVILDERRRVLVERFAGYNRLNLTERINYAFSGQVYRQSFIDNLIIIFLLIIKCI